MQDIQEEYGNTGSGDKYCPGGLLADPPVRGFVYHAVLYLGVMLVLLAVNLRMTPESFWVQWIAFLWGILLIWNGWKVFSARKVSQR